MYDLIIIGGGPAGAAAGVYAARKKLKTALIAETFGGQSVVSTDIENWIGTPHIPGENFAKALENHVREYAGDCVDVREGERAEKIEKTEEGFLVQTNKDTYNARAILVATGSARKQLDVPGAQEYEHRGITYCASCDGPLFAGKDLVVIGGGNAGFESAAQLLAYAKSVTLLHKNAEFKADPTTVDAVLKHPNMNAVPNAITQRVEGGDFAETLTYQNTLTGEEHRIPAEGIFVEIGSVPATEFVKDLVETDNFNRIVIDPRTQRASVEGVWAAGDCTDVLYHQNNIAAGDAVRALEDIYLWIKTQ